MYSLNTAKCFEYRTTRVCKNLASSNVETTIFIRILKTLFCLKSNLLTCAYHRLMLHYFAYTLVCFFAWSIYWCAHSIVFLHFLSLHRHFPLFLVNKYFSLATTNSTTAISDNVWVNAQIFEYLGIKANKSSTLLHTVTNKLWTQTNRSYEL